MMQEAIFDDPCFQPLVDHPSDHTVRDSLVKECAQVRVWDRIEGKHHTLPTTATFRIQ
jgi:hypothetical protein